MRRVSQLTRRGLSRLVAADHRRSLLLLEAQSHHDHHGHHDHDHCCVSRRCFAHSAPRLQTWALQKHRPWMCIKPECKKVNYARSNQCEACGEDKPSLMGWVCMDCSAQNHNGVRACKACQAPASNSDGYWACASCHKNNRVNDIDDNSKCGFCDYDMAPRTRTEADVMRIQQEISDRIKEQQLAYDTAPVDEHQEDREAGLGTNSIDPWAASNLNAAPPAPPATPTDEAVPDAKAALAGEPKPKQFEFKPYVYEQPKKAVSRLMRPRRPAAPAPSGPPGFQWMCRERSCGAMNEGSVDVCTACNTKIVPADWECDTCAAKNHWSRGICFNCTTPITPSWLCSRCRTRSSIYDAECRSCASPRPTVEPVDPRSLLSGSKPKGKKKVGIDWICQGCRGQNFHWRDRCFSCDMPRAGGAGDMLALAGEGGDGSGDALPVNDNNWMCDSCHASNFRTRTECWQCGKTATGASAAAAGGGDGDVPEFAKEGFQPGMADAPAAGTLRSWGKDEWTCGKCFAKNFKNRTECHKCSSKKVEAVVTRRVVVKKPVKI